MCLLPPFPTGTGICRVTRLFFYKTIKLERQNTGEFILLFNLTARKKQKNKQNPQWFLYPIPSSFLTFHNKSAYNQTHVHPLLLSFSPLLGQ